MSKPRRTMSTRVERSRASARHLSRSTFQGRRRRQPAGCARYIGVQRIKSRVNNSDPTPRSRRRDVEHHVKRSARPVPAEILVGAGNVEHVAAELPKVGQDVVWDRANDMLVLAVPNGEVRPGALGVLHGCFEI